MRLPVGKENQKNGWVIREITKIFKWIGPPYKIIGALILFMQTGAIKHLYQKLLLMTILVKTAAAAIAVFAFVTNPENQIIIK